MGRKLELYSCYWTLFLLAGDSLQTCFLDAVQLVVLTRHAWPYGLTVLQRFPAACYLHVSFCLFIHELYASVVVYPVGPMAGSFSMITERQPELDWNSLTASWPVRWSGVTSAFFGNFPGAATTPLTGLDCVADERTGSYAGALVIDLWWHKWKPMDTLRQGCKKHDFLKSWYLSDFWNLYFFIFHLANTNQNLTNTLEHISSLIQSTATKLEFSSFFPHPAALCVTCRTSLSWCIPLYVAHWMETESKFYVTAHRSITDRAAAHWAQYSIARLMIHTQHKKSMLKSCLIEIR